MYSTVIALIFLAFLLLYNLSRKNKWEGRPDWAKKMESDKLLSRGISAALMVISLLLLIFFSGTGAGIFAFIVVLMAVGSLIVLLSPFRYVNAKHLVIFFVLSLIFEIIIF